jgi:hypothetical protein
VRRRIVVLLVVGLPLAVPAEASAHGRATTVALDYRLQLDRASRSLPGVSVSILDGDRSLRLRVDRGLLVVRGDLREPMLRISSAGAFANRASVTAVAERIVRTGRGWERVSSSPSYTWHEHRLAPPPYDGDVLGRVAAFTIPATLNGRSVAITGSFIRYARPAIWPWAAAVVLLVIPLVAGLRRRSELRGMVATVLGSVAGLAALVLLAVFGAADAPNGRVAWAQIVGGGVLGAVLYSTLFRLHGVRRVQLAGFIGLAAAVVSLSYLSVFWHGVVVSLTPAIASRALLLVAFVAGAASAVLSLRFVEPA